MSVIAAVSPLTVAKLAGSISFCPNARRHSTELAANASIANAVRIRVRGMALYGPGRSRSDDALPAPRGSAHQVLRFAGDEGFDIVDQLIGEELHRSLAGPRYVGRQNKIRQARVEEH